MERLSGAMWSPLPSQGRGEGEGLFHHRSPALNPLSRAAKKGRMDMSRHRVNVSGMNCFGPYQLTTHKHEH